MDSKISTDNMTATSLASISFFGKTNAYTDKTYIA